MILIDNDVMKFMQKKKTRLFMWCRWIKTNINLVVAFIKT